MIDRASIAREWSQNVVPNFAVPETLYDHQMDAISLLKQGKHVFLGSCEIQYYKIIKSTKIKVLLLEQEKAFPSLELS